MAPIAVGDIIPDGNLSFVNEEHQLETVSVYSLVTGKKVLMIGVPGAFLPDSSWWYRPERIRMAFHPRRFQQTLFISVNDPHVADMWGRLCFPKNVPHVKFLADCKAAYATTLGFNIDLTCRGLGVRTRRFMALLEDRKRPPPIMPRAPIAVGDVIPDGVLTRVNQQDQIEPVSLHSLVTGKKVIVLGVRGAFLPRSGDLVRWFIEKADEFKSMDVQEILCVSVNDPYVMGYWKLAYYRDDTYINFLADSTAAYVASLGLVDYLSFAEYGIRSQRFAMLLEDRRVKLVVIDRPSNDMLLAGNMLVAMAAAELRAVEI